VNDTVIVRLRYAVTGGMEAAKRALQQNFLWNDEAPVKEISRMADQDNLHNAFTAKRFGVDINPDENTGYTNSETFSVAMFLENNCKQRNKTVCELARQALTMGTETSDQNVHSNALIWLEDEIKGLVEDEYLKLEDRESNAQGDSAMLAYDLLTDALARVNWLQIADVFLTQAKENQDANV
jgi:hypothetical protein